MSVLGRGADDGDLLFLGSEIGWVRGVGETDDEFEIRLHGFSSYDNLMNWVHGQKTLVLSFGDDFMIHMAG